MRFKYLAYDGGNRLQKGTVDAPTVRDATSLLISRGWFVKRILPVGSSRVGMVTAPLGGVSLIDKVLMAKHLATMLKSGITLSEALTVIAQQSSSVRFRRIISTMNDKVRSGQSLGSACALFPKVFDPLFINIIKVGEQSGTLEENLDYLASELEDRLELRRTVISASFYPAIVFLATLGLCSVLAFFVLPRIKQLFITLKFQLPLSTKILLAVADIVEHYGIIIAVGIVALIIVGRIAITLNAVKPAWHWLLIHAPIAGVIIVNYNLALISRTLGVLLKSGLTIDQSLSVAEMITENRIYRSNLRTALLRVQKGTSVSAAFARLSTSRWRPLFPILMVKMVGVAERTGRYDESFAYLAEFYEKEVKLSVRNMTTVLEPVLLLIVGGIVGFVAVSVITPIYQVTAQFRR